MKHVNDLISAPQAGSPTTPAANSRPLLPRETTLALWTMMGRLYGHRWSSAYGEEVDPGNVWAAVLHGITEQQVRYGLRQCVEQGLDWPPTAPEFRQLCLGGRPSWERAQVERADREAAAKALPAPFDYDDAAARLAKIRGLLG